MSNKDRTIIIGILIGALIIAAIINVLLSINGFIPSAFSNKEWFGFWTNYTTGVFALVIGYLAISFGNKNSERALQQQNMLLVKQESNKITEEIAQEIKRHNCLFNIFDHTVTFVSMDHDDIPGMNARVMQDRARINECRINWDFMRQMYLSSPYLTEIVDEYDKCWRESVIILDEFLIVQTNLLLKVQEEDRSVRSMGIYNQILLNQTQQKQFKDDKELEIGIQETINGRDEQQRIRESCAKEISRLIEKSKNLTDRIVKAQESLTSASICFLSKLNGFVFVNPDEFRNKKKH